MKLISLLDSARVKDFVGMENQIIQSIHYDSRDVKPGGLFVAIPGLRTDGHAYIDDAVTGGAVAVITEKACSVPSTVTAVQVENARRALAAVSSAFYGNPSRELFVIGITGTNGKTTTSYLLESILAAAGIKVGVIGTINYRFGGVSFVNPVTTPESLDLMRILRQMADSGVTHVVLEVSSHALDLDRIAFCELDVGVFTNLSRDHLDYHGDMEAYWQCKRRLCIEYLGRASKRRQGFAVINCDDPKGKELASEVSVECIRVGLSEPCSIRAEDIRTTMRGTSGMVKTPSGSFHFATGLVGRHNVYNILAAAGVATGMGLPIAAIKQGIEDLAGVPGRLEPVENAAGLSVFVDYAHTPEALESVLTALKTVASGRVITVFGCGGDRDQEKRPMMGAAAVRLSDLAVVTSDNPRTEAPEAILTAIVAGAATVGRQRYAPHELLGEFEVPGYVVQPDRRQAIELGLRVAHRGDTVLIAGKGHETYQIIGGETIPFDDRIEARKVLARLSAEKEP